MAALEKKSFVHCGSARTRASGASSRTRAKGGSTAPAHAFAHDSSASSVGSATEEIKPARFSTMLRPHSRGSSKLYFHIDPDRMTPHQRESPASVLPYPAETFEVRRTVPIRRISSSSDLASQASLASIPSGSGSRDTTGLPLPRARRATGTPEPRVRPTSTQHAPPCPPSGMLMRPGSAMPALSTPPRPASRPSSQLADAISASSLPAPSSRSPPALFSPARPLSPTPSFTSSLNAGSSLGSPHLAAGGGGGGLRGGGGGLVRPKPRRANAGGGSHVLLTSSGLRLPAVAFAAPSPAPSAAPSPAPQSFGPYFGSSSTGSTSCAHGSSTLPTWPAAALARPAQPSLSARLVDRYVADTVERQWSVRGRCSFVPIRE